MNRRSVEAVMDICEDQGWDAQVTYEKGIFDVYFKHTIHRDVVKAELLANGMVVNAPDYDKFHLRLV